MRYIEGNKTLDRADGSKYLKLYNHGHLLKLVEHPSLVIVAAGST